MNGLKFTNLEPINSQLKLAQFILDSNYKGNFVAIDVKIENDSTANIICENNIKVPVSGVFVKNLKELGDLNE